MRRNRNNNNRRGRKPNKGRRMRNSRQSNTVLLLRPNFPGQPIGTFRIASDFQKLTTTVTSGLIQTVITISVAGITNFAARFVGFEEYRIVRSVLRMNCFSSTNPGRIVSYVDPDDNSAPTLALSQAHRNMIFSAADVSRTHNLTYVPQDPAKQTWQTVASGTAATGYFKIYTTNATLGSSIVATDYIGCDMMHTIQFRGFVG